MLSSLRREFSVQFGSVRFSSVQFGLPVMPDFEIARLLDTDTVANPALCPLLALFVDLAFLHHEVHVFKLANIGQRIAVHGNDIRRLAGADGTE